MDLQLVDWDQGQAEHWIADGNSHLLGMGLLGECKIGHGTGTDQRAGDKNLAQDQWQ
jgi:hypothetical protein